MSDSDEAFGGASDNSAITIRANKGPQEMFLMTTADVALFGGAAGGGKSAALMFQPLAHIDNPNFGAIIFRRTNPQIFNEGALWDQSTKLYPSLGARPRVARAEWVFPSGAKVRFAHMEYEKSKKEWDGSQIALICFDELTSFTSTMFWYMLSRNRSTCGIRPYMRASCLAGDTYVQADGKLLRIDQCEQAKPSLLSIDSAGKLFAESPTGFFRRKTTGGLRIATTHGEVICTPDHRFYRWSPAGPVEAEASSLAAGDFLASVRQVPHGTIALDSDETYLVGYTVGDGGLTGRKHIPRLYWTEQNPEHTVYVATIAERVLKTKIGIHKRSRADAFSIYTTTARSPKALAFIRQNADALKTGVVRSIPSDVTAGDVNSVRGLLQGLYDAEGHVSEDAIAISVTSRSIIQQINMLLRRWGIIARLDSKQPPSPRKRWYKLTLCGRQLVMFAEKIGFRNVKKQAAAMRVSERIAASGWFRNRESDLVPIDRGTIHHLRSLFGKSWWNPNTNIRRDTTAKVLSAAAASGMDASALERWSAYAWERVRTVEKIELAEAFDVTMPSTHIYVAGNLLSHNCNPDADSWVAELVKWWINQDTGYPIPERSGVIRWFIREDGRLLWFDTKKQAARYLVKGGLEPEKAVNQPKSFTFIPAKLEDNPVLESIDPGYRANLLAMEQVERERLLGGNWKIRPAAGLKFPRDAWKYFDEVPTGLRRFVRFWDKAGTEKGKGARTAGGLMAELDEKDARDRGLPRYWVLDVIAERWDDAGRESKIRATAELDQARYKMVTIGMEQEPGSGGKHSAHITIGMLAGFDVYAERATTNKSARWSPLAAQQQIGNVGLVRGNWNWAEAVEELDALAGDARTSYGDYEGLDKGKLKDIADCLSGAFKFLAGGRMGVVEGDLIASGDPDQYEHESKPLDEEDIADLPDYFRELVEESNRLGRDDWRD